ncbi:meiotic recombination directing protein KNAG_0B04810 [Huiozyma naganishii CBS 8797]|uniref:Aldehyde dehydrogenase domain-containing protein n=1 Tax=Huiozyma naganishii (strain ATCC MYA-139 / BCRC 22969 / CBS 8797 / KCTC 17520 / NBRC 10181 / NCYC 3082 / Yp74L-3) TaxID=1071383 RepID=J7R273_HUIN7|nr:hypothetical protein KNAG_0B04810 [Kazachstania naganishii CBS 8797]CCK68915.1 hypothetical protein KNAG_0B04810 [Kazachstania naganishii CBS 8797]
MKNSSDSSQFVLNGEMLNQLNATVKEFVNRWLLNQPFFANKEMPQSTNGTAMCVTVVVLLLPIAIVYFRRHCCGNGRLPKPVPFKVSLPDQAKPNWKGKRLSSTEVVDPQNPNMIQCYCPATGQFLGSFPSKTREDIDLIMKQAQSAHDEFRHSSFERRLRVLVSLREYVLNNQDLIARVACRDSGKTMLDASMGEILVTLEKLAWVIKHGRKILQPSKRKGPTNLFMKMYKGAEVRYEPLGVISAIVSWNYPFHNLLGPIISSIITGNAIVMKCSEQVVWSSEFFIKLVQTCLRACDEDPNLVQLCYCLPPTESNGQAANYFTAHPTLKHITFIGSAPVAKHVLRHAAESITPLCVELGGKDAFIVLDSVTALEKLSSIILRGSFQSAGQNCIGIERVIVSSKNYDKLVSIIAKRFKDDPFRLGSDIDHHVEGVDMGAMISNNRFPQLESLVKDAVSKGARLLTGGSPYTHPKYPQGNYFQPTMLVDVTPDMDVAQNEVFGPILVMMKGESTKHCIELANSAPFGLGSSVFGNDYQECNYVANELKTGNVAINDFATFYVCQLPFGGINGSGYGKFGGEEGLLGICNAKSVCYDALPFVSTQIPKPLDYPINSNGKAWTFVKAFITASYTTSPWQLIKSVMSLAKNGN